MATQGREQRLVFGEVAELYDRYRPGYPEAVFDRILEHGDLGPGDPALEVGCGTGRATLPLARRRLRLTALEPSPEMAQMVLLKTADLPSVRVEESSFEDWSLPDEPFRLVTSAQAWHWVRPEVRYLKAHQALGPAGCLALIWNTAVKGGTSPELEEAIDDVYRRVAPNVMAGVPGDSDEDRRLEIAASGHFVDVVRDDYPWSTTYSAEHYLALLKTQSDHRLLHPATLERLLEAIAGILAAHGDELTQSYCTFLYLARRGA